MKITTPVRPQCIDGAVIVTFRLQTDCPLSRLSTGLLGNGLGKFWYANYAFTPGKSAMFLNVNVVVS